MKLSEILTWWASFSNISEQGKLDHEEMAGTARKLEAVAEDAKELRIQMLAMKKEFLSSNPTRQEKIMAGVFSKWITELDALADLET